MRSVLRSFSSLPVVRNVLAPLVNKDFEARIAALESRAAAAGTGSHTYFNALDYRGSLRPISHLSQDELISIRCSFALTEHTSMLFAVAGMHFEGDYFEFGCLHLDSFLTVLNAMRINDLNEGDTGGKKTFYGFDVFGDTTPKDPASLKNYTGLNEYYTDLARIASWQHEPDLQAYYDKIKKNGIYVDQCRLVRGFFNETFTDAFVTEYRATGRRAGFVNIDCDMPASHAAVLQNLGHILGDNSWIYFREGLEGHIMPLIQAFGKKIAQENDLRMMPMRTVGAGGILYRCYRSSVFEG